VINGKMTLIVCPNDIVGQWDRSISEIFPDSIVTTGKEAFYQKYNENKRQYLVLNYDKFSQEESPNLILKLAKEKVDFVVLDEIHFVKKRDEESSQRRKNLDGLMTAVRKKNRNIKVLGLSATPLVNNLMEGRSLLELITGKIYDAKIPSQQFQMLLHCMKNYPWFPLENCQNMKLLHLQRIYMLKHKFH
jgi:SNF2 family DNA or RNA helicase